MTNDLAPSPRSEMDLLCGQTVALLRSLTMREILAWLLPGLVVGALIAVLALWLGTVAGFPAGVLAYWVLRKAATLIGDAFMRRLLLRTLGVATQCADTHHGKLRPHPAT